MKPEVREGFLDWSVQFEGLTTFLYLDVKGLVTIGSGLLVDPSSLLAGLEFTRLDGTVATANEVSAAWLTVKGRQDMRLRGGMAFQSLTTLRATKASLERVLGAKLDQIEANLKPAFPKWEAWPAPAQQGVLSMAWAMGPGFTRNYPRFVAAANAGDWNTAAGTCHMDDANNPGLKPRNGANQALFLAAGRLAKTGDDDSPIFIAPDPPDHDPEAA